MITIQTKIQAPIAKVWACWTNPQDIMQWNFASDDWCCPSATNDLKPGGKFTSRMEAKDGSMGFDFGGTYQEVEKEKLISYTMGDGRKVVTRFVVEGTNVKLTESFETEGTHTDEQQRAGWQSILDNFKKHVESKA